MKFTTFFLLVACLQVSAYGVSQTITLSLKNASLENVFNQVKKQTGLSFIWDEQTLKDTRPIDIDVNSASIFEVMNRCTKDQPLTYQIIGKIVVISQYNMPAHQSDEIADATDIGGQVTNENGQPVEGASITIKGTNKGTTTDANGNFTLQVSDGNGMLVVSYVGYQTVEMPFSKSTSAIKIILKQAEAKVEEVTVVGYGTQRKTEVTSAVATVKSGDFVKGAVRDIGQLLQGKVAGLTIGTPSGDPSVNSEILLRGIATLFSSTQPLILIDGIPGNLNTVAPEDIERVDVLKDGSAAAIYGTRGTNGVILITTRRPSGNISPTISYDGYVSTQAFVNVPDMLNAEEYRKQLAEGTVGFKDEGSSTDWLKSISRNSPITNVHQLTLRGGSNKTNYIASLAYRSLKGVFIGSDNRTINGRIDVNHSMFNNKLKLNFLLINTDAKSSVNFDKVIFRNALRYNPTSPVYNPDGTYFENFGPTENYNPVAMLKEQFGGNESQSSRLGGNIIWSPIENLQLKMLASRTKYTRVEGYGQTKKHYSTTSNGLNGYASKSDYQSIDQLLELTGEYSKSVSFHKFSGLAGYSYQDNINQSTGLTNHDFPVGNFSYIDNIGIGNAIKSGQATLLSRKEGSNLMGFFGRLSYSYKEKYLLLASLRYEAASQLVGTNQPWGSFPAISVGWRISEEDFIKDIAIVDNLKLRIGYGVTGTSPNDLFLGVRRLGYRGSFLINGVWQPSIIPISNENPDLRWEEKKETNIGLDFSFLKGRISGSLDVYKRKTDGLLFDYQVPSPPNLFPTTKANVGIMENKGVELLLTFIPVNTNKFTWTTTVTFSTNRNKLVSLENDLYKTTNPYFDEGETPTPIGDYSHRIEIGQPIGNFWGLKVIDITDDGHWVYEDKDGKPITTRPDPATDRKIIGNGLPKYYGGWNNTFTYGRFNLNVTMRGAFGFEIINSQRMLHENPGFASYNQLSSARDKVFGKSVLNQEVNVEFNSYYVEKGDYWKIDNVILGYDLNLSRIKHIQSARIYASTLNTFTFTGYKGMDPEVIQVGLSPGYDDRDKYPTSRIYTVGLNITFN